MTEKAKRDAKTVERVAIALYSKYWNDSLEVADARLTATNGVREAWERVARYAVGELAGELVKPENAENAAGKVSIFPCDSGDDGAMFLEGVRRLTSGIDSSRERVSLSLVATVVPR